MTYILLAKALHKERTVAESAPGFYFDIYPYPYQKEILDKLEAERLVRDHWRNLIVAATGTGKTVVAAFDYKRFRDTNPGKPCSLLFVAHREEILKQSLDCFRMVLKDNNFGELFVGRYEPSGYGPNSLRHLFMSIQTFNSRGFDSLTSPELYDYIVVDEFHHAAARTYQKLLAHYRPKILLGLTATPERMDGKSILEFFDNRIAAEIRLPEAIERKLLCPFQYFGVTDTVDLNSLKWTRGGYDRNELINIYSFSGHVAERRGKMIIESIYKYITDINEVKGLGFCVSREHAKFMAEFFNDYGVPSLYLTSASNDEERSTAKNRLVSGEIRFIFVVDLYNEGVDIPEVDTILFLRPTESLTVFLQQLGRGLRLAENKECLTVLDFIGQANKRYNFQEKFEALLSNTQQSLTRQLKDGFVSLPKGCYIQLEKKAREHILDNIRSAFGQKSGLITKIAAYEEDTGDSVSLAKFLDYYHLDLKSVYKRYSFSRLCVDAGVRDDFNEPEEVTITKAFARVCSIDSRRWISFLLEILPKIDTLNKTKLTASQNRMLLMFHYTVWQKSLPDCGFKNLVDSFARLKQNPVMFGELLELLRYCYDKIDFVDEYVDLGYDSSLDLYCRYSRDQILAAVDYFTEKRKPSMREGVKYIPEKEMDIFLITLNKAEKDYSPSTMYEDYSINEYLFHWQSQSTTSDTSPTGQRYIKHREMGSKILLFVREFKDDVLGASPYTFLGLADYVSHEGSRPMNIIWQLQKPIPPKYLKKTNKLVVG
jgi:superfamily II DNA or RNA helicase